MSLFAPHRVQSFSVRRALLVVALSSALVALAAPRSATAQAAAVSPAARTAVVTRLAEHMQARFVFPDAARRVADDLRAQLAAGAFDQAASAHDLAKLLTQRLQAQTNDKHLRVYPRPAHGGHVLGSPAQLAQSNYGFEKLQRLTGNIGYLDLRYFVDDPAAKAVAVASLNWLAHTEALIVDLRRNGGGSPEQIRFIQSYLFDAPTLLNTLHWRDDAKPGGYRIDEFRTSATVDGKRYGQSKPVIVLTSNYTFSGGEEFAYNLQTRKRATLIGETTGGGAHPGAQFDLGHGLAAHLSTGRAVNPLTNANWEGTGVKPDIAVAADDALRRAQLELLKTMIAAEKEAPRKAALEARVKSLNDGKADN